MTELIPELDLLVARHLDGGLSGEESSRLGRWLRTDAAARRAFLAQCELAVLVREVPQHAGGRSQRTAGPSVRSEAAGLARFRVTAIAAAVLLAAGAVAIYLAALRAPRSALQDAGSATLASVIDTTGGGTLLAGDSIVAAGDVFAAGELSLDAGGAEFRLDSGADVHIVGPARLTVHDPMSVTMARGTAMFDCPPQAKGFTVRTPAGIRVTDLGTRFSMRVHESGPMAVCVDEGIVQVHDHSGRVIEITAGQLAVAVDGLSIQRASSMLVHDASVVAAARSDGMFTVGSLIEVGDAPLWITHLGVQDASAHGAADDGFHRADSIPVGLWDEGGRQMLARVEVASASMKIGSWRYEAIPGGPVRLEANTRYRIGALVGSDLEWFLDADQADAFSAGVSVRLIDGCYIGGEFAAPTMPGNRAPGRWGAANAIVIPIDCQTPATPMPEAERRAQKNKNETVQPQEQQP